MWSLVMMAWVAAVGAFGSNASQPSVATSITLLDSVRVAENDKLLVGQPNAIAVARDGSVFVSDIADRRVLRIDRRGQLTLVARKGGGPGEVMSPNGLAVLGDSVLVVHNNRRLEMFDLRTLKFRGGALANWPTTSMSAWNGSLVFGSLMVDSGTSIALFADSSKAPRRGGVVHEMYRKSPPVAQAFGYVGVARDDSTVQELFEISNTMYRWRVRDGVVTDSVVMSVAARRGARPDVIAELLRDPKKAATLAFNWSQPLLVANVSSDRTAVVFFDPTLKGSTYVGPSYLQLVDWRRHRSCSDVRLPVPTEAVPRFAIRGDTLTAVVQHADDADCASTWVVRWRIATSRC